MIIVENGSIVAGANSYVSLIDARTILAAYGQDLNTDDTIAEQELLSAARYIESFRNSFKGIKSTREQTMQWPRRNAYIDGYLIPTDEIPVELVNAQAFAAYEVSAGNNLQPTDDGRKIASEKVDVLEVSYFESSATSSTQIYKVVMDELKGLLQSSNSIPLVRT